VVQGAVHGRHHLCGGQLLQLLVRHHVLQALRLQQRPTLSQGSKSRLALMRG
jgi:hypothetical protein